MEKDEKLPRTVVAVVLVTRGEAEASAHCASAPAPTMYVNKQRSCVTVSTQQICIYHNFFTAEKLI